MRAYLAFTGKEFTEFFRTYKLLIAVLVFLLFGMMSPLMAKYLPELIEQFMPEGIEMAIQEPTALDSWMQFNKNVSQMGTFVIVILLSGVMAGEYSKGTLVHMLTKGLPRQIVVLSKFTAAALLWTGVYILCFSVAYGYTWFYWNEKADIPGLLETVMAMWLFGVLLVSITLLGGVIMKTSYGSLLFTGGLVAVQILLNVIPKTNAYNPIQLISRGTPLLQGQLESGSMFQPMAVAAVCVAVCIVSACMVFNKKKL